MNLIRIPTTENHSLQAWNAADEYMVNFILDQDIDTNVRLATFNDRFGYLAVRLNFYPISTYIDLNSQQDAILHNLGLNELPAELKAYKIDEAMPIHDIALINAPKSLDQLEVYLSKIYEALSSDGIVVMGFMTKHFTPNITKLFSKYFQEVEQSQAEKKSRLLIASNKKVKVSPLDLLTEVRYPQRHLSLQQYRGVFSSGRIDVATQYLLSNFDIRKEENEILEIGSGNGIITYMMRLNHPTAQYHLMDDQYSSILSSQLNLKQANVNHHWDYNLDRFDDLQFDLIVSNPPFHFGHEVDFTIAHAILVDAKRVLKNYGRIVVVSNNNINYKSMLDEDYEHIYIRHKNDRFTVWEIRK